DESFLRRTVAGADPHLSSPLRRGGTAWLELNTYRLISTQRKISYWVSWRDRVPPLRRGEDRWGSAPAEDQNSFSPTRRSTSAANSESVSSRAPITTMQSPGCASSTKRSPHAGRSASA